MSKKKTHEEYVNEVKKINPNIEVIEEYQNNRVPILHKCRFDEYEWKASPSNILKGHGCPKCANKKRRTPQEYRKNLLEVNSNIIALEDFIDVKTPILHKCMICNHIWKTAPDNLLSGKGCPKCNYKKIGDRSRKSHEDYVQQVSNINPNITIVGTYINNATPILCKCNIDGYEWKALPTNILQGHGCPKCSIKTNADKKRKTQETYIKEVNNINPDLYVIGEYITAFIPVKHQCLKCGNVWQISPLNVLNGEGCPQCNESSGERVVRQWLEKMRIKYESQKKFADCKDKKSLPFDFYLPDYNTCIEFDGIQHRQPIERFGGEEAFKIRVKHDNIKTQYCKDNNIRLLRINNVKDIDEELNNFLLA